MTRDETKLKYGLIGADLSYSYSAEIHNALGQYSYECVSLPSEEVERFVKQRSLQGCNVTIPYKKKVMAFCDEITPLARKIGAVNTLYRAGNKLIGHNTDYEGFCYMLKRKGIALQGKTVLILGTGATSSVACKAALDLGAAKIYKASRTPQNLKESDHLMEQKREDGQCLSQEKDSAKKNKKLPEDKQITVLHYKQLCETAEHIEVIINTTPVGTYPDNLERLLDLDDFPRCCAVIDVVYNPFRTALLLQAKKRGLLYTNGLSMLVAQATAAAGCFLGKPGAFSGENEKLIAWLQAGKKNIILIGMPGCGKTTIGEKLAKLMKRPFVDIDGEIEKKTGQSIPEIFRKEGEEWFRKMETEIVKSVGKEQGQIIATGGGAIVREENRNALTQNGIMVQIVCPLEELETKDRPLSQGGVKKLLALKETRDPLYREFADLSFRYSKKAMGDTGETAAKQLNSLLKQGKNEFIIN